MDFELNKILGAILGTLLFVMGIGFLAEAIYEPIKGAGPGYALPEPADTDTGDTTTTVPAVADIGTLLAAADPKAGESSAKKCQACHDFTSGGPNKTGPDLYDVVERVIASHPGFGYSAVLLEHQAKGDTWTYQNLDEWLLSPKTFAPGTKMTFAGIKDDKDRANVIAFLSTLSASPKPFPAPASPAGAAPAAETTTAAPAAVSAEQPAAAAGVETSTTTEGATNAPAGGGTTTETPAGAEPSQTAPASAASGPAEASSSAAQ